MPMKIVRLLFIFLFSATLFAQNYTQKYSANLKDRISNISDDESVLVWVFFKDKGFSLNKYFENPQNVVSEKSLERREKVLPKSDLIDVTDLPVDKNYILQLEAFDIHVKQISKWFNGISTVVPKSDLPILASLNFVRKIDVVASYKKPEMPETENQSAEVNQFYKSDLYSYNYGNSLSALEQIKVPEVHSKGFTGKGVVICVLDAGVSNLSHEVFSKMLANNQIIAKYDFVNHDTVIANQNDMGDGSHGTYTLALIGGFKEGELIGPAFNSKYILAKTENTDSESSIEEDNWIAALEWADSIGVDVTSTSLGYRYDFTSGSGYTSQQMDGNTARITIAADLAVKKGIVVVVSAGNEGMVHAGDQNTLGAPADGDSVITVGAVDVNGKRVSFSSYGPTSDGRHKPDVMADGFNNYIPASKAGTVNGYGFGSGTSFSCPLVAGVAALIIEAHPFWTPIQVRDALRNTASDHNSPNDTTGWGIIDALAAINYNSQTNITAPSLTGPANRSTNQPIEVTLKWDKIQNADKYYLQVATDSAFSNMIFKDSTITENSQQLLSLNSGTDYFWRVAAKSAGGTSSFSSTWKFTTAGGKSEPTIPDSYVLEQNYPNPFNPSTRITYKIPEGGFVTMKVYNLLGNQVATLVNESKPAGTYSVEFDAKKRDNPLPSGVYFYRLQVGNFVSTKKMVVMK